VIVPAGILVEADLAPVVARILAEAVRRDPGRESAQLRRLLADLDASARTSVASGASTSVGRPTLTTRERAQRDGVTDRTIRRRAAAGQIPGATKEGGPSWRIPI
jgi:hypothetical protein